MKRSTNVALTLLVPAMAAFGCGHQPATPVHRGGVEQTAQDCDTPAKPGEPEKPKCEPKTQQQSSTRHSSYGRSSSYSRPWFGGYNSGSTTSPSSTSVATSHTTGSTHSTSHVSYGGFGHTGSHSSGGS